MLRRLVTAVTVVFVEFTPLCVTGSWGRLEVMASRGSVARQVFVLQLALVLVVVAVGSALAVLDARSTQREQARQRTIDVAQAVADSPAVAEALATQDPSARLQPFAEEVRRDTDTDFVVVMGL